MSGYNIKLTGADPEGWRRDSTLTPFCAKFFKKSPKKFLGASPRAPCAPSFIKYWIRTWLIFSKYPDVLDSLFGSALLRGIFYLRYGILLMSRI